MNGGSKMRIEMPRKKVDPGTFSFLEPGWYVWHAVAILIIFFIGVCVGRENY